MKTCFLFPGQGAQFPGMAKDFFETSKAVRTLFQTASEAASMDLKKLLFESDEETLRQTKNTQIAMVTAEAAAALSTREHGIQPSGAAGFSVGEWAALAEAGVISLYDMFRLVAERGRLMDEAGNRSGGSTMSAVLYLSPEKIEQVIQEAGLEHCWIANYNSPTQCVISGTETDIAIAEEKLRQAGAKRVIRLKVSGAFHSPLMQEAYEAFKEIVDATPFSDPKISLYSNVTGQKYTAEKRPSATPHCRSSPPCVGSMKRRISRPMDSSSVSRPALGTSSQAFGRLSVLRFLVSQQARSMQSSHFRSNISNAEEETR